MKTGQEEDNTEDNALKPEVYRGLSAVASAPAKNIFIMVVLAIIVLIAMWYAFFAPTEEEKKAAAKKPPVEVSNKIATSKPATADIETKVTALPALPAPPPLVTPTPPPPPPPPAVEAAPAPIVAPILKEENFDNKAQRDARLKSAIIFGGGSGGGDGGGGSGAGADGGGKAKGLFGSKKSSSDDETNGNFTPKRTDSDQQKVTRVGNMGVLVAQGKVVDAILETAVNTDLPGVLRAIVSRDVYAETGKRILIPKGSRLIGSYMADVKIGQRRVNIIWTRIILPNGFDVAVDSPGTDQLGRAGVEGLVDNKFKELFGSAILISSISTGFAIAAQNLSGAGASTSSTSTGSDGSTTTTSTADATQLAISSAVQQISGVGQTVTQQIVNTRPTITVDQGTRLKVFVNRDLIFSNEVATNVRFIR